MRKLQILIAAIAMTAALIGCKKIELQPSSPSTMLPLAVGNEWVYVDSFITNSSLPSSDTLVRACSYKISRRKLVDYQANGTKPPTRYERIEAWEMENSNISYAPLTLVSRNDTLFASFYFWNLYPREAFQCNQIGKVLNVSPAFLQAPVAQMWAVMADPFGDGDPLQFGPMFQELPECLPVLGPSDYNNVNYTIFYQALNAAPTTNPLTTLAGTFDCYDFGTQRWAAGIGMVESIQRGEAAFYDQNNNLQTTSVVWKRSLISYTIK